MTEELSKKAEELAAKAKPAADAAIQKLSTKNQISMKFVLSLVIFPLIGQLISVIQAYVSTQIWDWTSVIACLSYGILPASLAYFKRLFDTDYDDMEKKYQETELALKADIDKLKDENTSLQITTKLQNYDLETMRKYVSLKDDKK